MLPILVYALAANIRTQDHLAKLASNFFFQTNMEVTYKTVNKIWKLHQWLNNFQDDSELDVGGGNVLQMVKNLPEGLNFKLFANFFTNLAPAKTLHSVT